MYGGQLLDADDKRTYKRSCPVRPAVHKQRRSGGRCRGQGCLGQSDHNMVEFSILAGVRRGNSKTATLDFQRADFKLFRRLVGGVPWGSILECKGVQDGWLLFKKEVLKVQEQAELQNEPARKKTGVDE